MKTGVVLVVCRGHPNVQLLHETTLEATVEPRLTPRGDCIACVSAKVKIHGPCRGLARGFILVYNFDGKAAVARFTGTAGDCRKPIIRRSSFCRDALVCNASLSARSIHGLAKLLQSPFARAVIVVEFYEAGAEQH